MSEYTREEAIETVLKMRARFGGVMPTKIDYEEDSTIDLEALARALNVKNYAGVNIAVLRELRKREGRKVNILDDSKDNMWQSNNFIVNSEKQGEREEKEKQAGTYESPSAKIKKRIDSSNILYWDEKSVAESVMKFYKRYGRIPSDKDIQVGGRFRMMDEQTPSSTTVYKFLGNRRSKWLDECKKILRKNKKKK